MLFPIAMASGRLPSFAEANRPTMASGSTNTVVPERDQLKLHGKALPITPGMPVDVSILTGERSVMQYLLKPVLRGVQRSLQER